MRRCAFRYLILPLSMVFLVSGGVLAAGSKGGRALAAPTEGVAAADPGYATSRDGATAGDVSVQSLQLLQYGESYLKVVSGRNLRTWGSTQAQRSVQIITLDLYLQRWNGSQWVDIDHATFKRTYDSYVYGEKDVTVGSAGYYRTRAVHTASDGSITETLTSVTGYLWVP